MELVRDLGEAGVLARIVPYCLPGMVGDDGAVLLGSVIVTTDVLVEEVHFSEATTPPDSVGWRAAAANLSDLAAMGCADPLGLLVGLGMPGTTPMSWVEGLYAGLRECCALFATGVIGGDVCRAPVRLVAITALGQGKPWIQRGGAQVGDWILVTGWHGGSRGGLEVLWQGMAEQVPELVRLHQYPRPRLDVVQQLHQLAIGEVIGGMDSSDGLADALVQISEHSGVGIVLEQLPTHPLVAQHFPAQAQAWTLFGGEDFELVLSVRPPQAEQILTTIPGCQKIGQVVPGSGVLWQGSRLQRQAAFQHFP
ncbi:MAG: thiamine-phosphate kinase [Thermostichales cyanobacterium SZTDM-1c_bins_54]